MVDRARIRLPGLHLLSLAVHRHLPAHESIEPHHHPWSQALLYLGGRGRQLVRERGIDVEPGTLVVLPPRCEHSFLRTADRAPLCLTVNFRLPRSRRAAPAACALTRSELALVRQLLARIEHLHRATVGRERWGAAVAILELFLVLMRAAGWVERLPSGDGTGGDPAVRNLLTKVDGGDSLAAIVQRSGYQRDHLNRLVKRATGLTLGQYRAQRRLARAKDMLKQGVRITDVAATVGLPDQGYFARWFRRQTGQTPSAWRRT